MTDRFLITAQDMLLQNKLFKYESAQKIPLSFTLGGERMTGIPDTFLSVVRNVTRCAQMSITEISGIDAKGLEICAEYTRYMDFPVTEWCVNFTDRGRRDSDIVSGAVLSGIIEGEEPVLEWGNGDTVDEDGFDRFSAKLDRKITVSTADARGSMGASPFIRLLFKDFGVIIAVGWSGGWSFTAEPAANGVRISLGQKRFNMRIKTGETIRTPKLTMLAWQGDAQRGTNIWRRFYREHIMPLEKNGEKLKPRFFLHTFEIGGSPGFTGITAENQIESIEKFRERSLNPDAWWIDAGWYSCDREWYFTGDWHPDAERLPDGFRPVSDKLHEGGTELLVWFEPERVRENSRFDYQHPEWLLHNENDADDKNRLVNYADPACLSFITDMLDNIIKTSGIDIYRQDFNFNPLPFWESNEDPDRVGALENLHVQGVLRLFDALQERNPGLIIDCCASGGTRNDLDTLKRAVPLQYTDMALSKPPVKQKQYEEMFAWMPYFRSHAMAHDNMNGDFDGTKRPPDEYAYLTAFAPAVTCMLNPDDEERYFKLAGRMRPVWEKAAHYMLDGDYYPLSKSTKSAADWYCVQFDSPSETSGFIEVIRNSQAKDSRFTVKPFIRANCHYTFTNAGTGEEKHADSAGLMSGLTFYMPARRGEVWFYTCEEKEN